MSKPDPTPEQLSEAVSELERIIHEAAGCREEDEVSVAWERENDQVRVQGVSFRRGERTHSVLAREPAVMGQTLILVYPSLIAIAEDFMMWRAFMPSEVSDIDKSRERVRKTARGMNVEKHLSDPS